MHKWKINDEQRIILNLSEFSFAVVEQDMLEFNTKSLSSFVCRVFENYYLELRTPKKQNNLKKHAK